MLRGFDSFAARRVATYRREIMYERTEFDLTVREVLTRDRNTNEEKTAWRVESENLPRPTAGDSAADALRTFADQLESDDEKTGIEPEDLETEDGSEI